jgi:5'-3' exonuclease
MGIQGGVKNCVIRSIGIPNSGVARVHLSKFRGKRIVIDWANIAYRFLSRSNTMAQFKNEFVNLIHKFAREGIEILFVFDGKPRNEKSLTIEHRKSARSKAMDKIVDIIEHTDNPKEDLETIMHLAKRVKTIALSHVNECKELFTIHRVCYMHLEEYEADCIFKSLLDNTIADICFSGDMDTLAYGCKKIILDLDFKEDTVVEIDLEKLISYLEVSPEQLKMAFILSGTDWNCGIKRSNFVKNLELIKKYSDIPGIIANLEEINRGLPEGNQIEIPNRFDWQLSVEIYSTVLETEVIDKIRDILKQQAMHSESMKSKEGFNILLEYGKSILANDPDLKYIRKYQEYIFWKYSYRINLISSSGYKQKDTHYPLNGYWRFNAIK